MADVGATNVPFRIGHLTNRLAAFETRAKNREPLLVEIAAETPKWIVAWKDPAPVRITFDLKSDQPLTQCRLVFSGAMPALVVRGSTDGKGWTWLASTSEEVAGTRSDMLFLSGDPHDIRDVKDVRLYLGGAHRSGKGKTGKFRAHAFRYVRFDFARRKAKDAFELCEVDIWGPRTK